LVSDRRPCRRRLPDRGLRCREWIRRFTHDLDFGALLAVRGASRPSVIQVRTQDVLPSAIGDPVVHAIQAVQAQLEDGALVTIEPTRARIRILPI
jgi:hypothetical protein